MESDGSQEIISELQLAREKLAGILPPQPDKLLRALQNVERALQYAGIENGLDKGLGALRDALRALNSIENRNNLPPKISLETSAALTKMLSAFRRLQEQIAIHAGSYHGPERRSNQFNDDGFDFPRRRADDTQDGWKQLEDLLEETRPSAIIRKAKLGS